VRPALRMPCRRGVLVTGGNGPTPDDLTTEALAAAFGAPLHERPEILGEHQRHNSRAAGSPGGRPAIGKQGAVARRRPGVAPSTVRPRRE